MPIPTPQDQVSFLQNVQRILNEGLFVASYKYALLRALADLAITKGDDSGDELTLQAREIAEVMVEVYWRQVRPFRISQQREGLLLKQNTGRQAAIIRTVAELHSRYAGSLSRLKRDSQAWNALANEVASVVAEMPLWKLQRVGGEVIDFLYANAGRGRTVTLRPGVAFCLRRFYGILRNLVEGAWVNYVRTVNAVELGHDTDIGSFLFGSERAALETYRPLLRELQSDECFYCRRPLRSAGDVDHFVPWSRYPLDLAHNFVLAHNSCNARKRDHLAAEEHLGRWVERNDRHESTIQQFVSANSLAADHVSSVNICRWAYAQTEKAGGLVWVADDQLIHLRGEWQRLLTPAKY